MKRINYFVVIVIVILLSLPAAAAPGHNFGVGIVIGEPTGLGLKVWTGRGTAFAAAAAWSFKDEGKWHVHLDYLLHRFGIFQVDRGKLPIYYGIGGRVKFEAETRVGVRFPLGICYIFNNRSFDIFFEIVPLLDLAPETRFSFNASLGARIFF